METQTPAAKIPSVAEMIQKYPKTISKEAFIRLDPKTRKQEITDVLSEIRNTYLASSLNFMEKSSPEFKEALSFMSMSGGKQRKYNHSTRKQVRAKTSRSRKNLK